MPGGCYFETFFFSFFVNFYFIKFYLNNIFMIENVLISCIFGKQLFALGVRKDGDLEF